MHTARISGLALCFVFLAACGDSSPKPSAPSVEAGKPGEAAGESLADAGKKQMEAAKAALDKQAADAAAFAKKTADETAAKLADAATAARAEAIKGLKATIDSLQPQLDALRKHGETLDPVKKSVFNPVMAGLDQKFGEAMKTLGAMGSSNDWEALKAKLAPMLEELKSGLTTATKSFM